MSDSESDDDYDESDIVYRRTIICGQGTSSYVDLEPGEVTSFRRNEHGQSVVDIYYDKYYNVYPKPYVLKIVNRLDRIYTKYNIPRGEPLPEHLREKQLSPRLRKILREMRESKK